jgi:4-amino-4-deoxy-L-arabinose transferase-like glycosyltransferase
MAAVLGLALALRLAFGLGYWVDKPLTMDEQEYLLLARNLADGRGFVYAAPGASRTEGRHVERAPLYPVLLAGLSWLAPQTVGGAGALPVVAPGPVKVAQAILGTLAVWILAGAAGRAAGRRAWLAGAAIAAVYPPFVTMDAYVLSETVSVVLALAAASLLDRGAARTDGRGRVQTAAAGVAAGLATLARPATLVFIGFVGAWLLARRRIALAVALGCAVALTLAPWMVRQRAASGRFTIVAAEGGVTFWTGNNPLARGEGDLAANPSIKRVALELERRMAGQPASAVEAMYYREAWAFIREQPLTWAGLLARKAFYTIVPVGASYTLHSRLYLAMSALPYLAVLPVGVAGVLGLRRRRASPVALWLLAASTVAVCVVFFPQERFRVPGIDPALIVGASFAVARLGPGRRTQGEP